MQYSTHARAGAVVAASQPGMVISASVALALAAALITYLTTAPKKVEMDVFEQNIAFKKSDERAPLAKSTAC